MIHRETWYRESVGFDRPFQEALRKAFKEGDFEPLYRSAMRMGKVEETLQYLEQIWPTGTVPGYVSRDEWFYRRDQDHFRSEFDTYLWKLSGESNRYPRVNRHFFCPPEAGPTVLLWANLLGTTTRNYTESYDQDFYHALWGFIEDNSSVRGSPWDLYSVRILEGPWSDQMTQEGDEVVIQKQGTLEIPEGLMGFYEDPLESIRGSLNAWDLGENMRSWEVYQVNFDSRNRAYLVSFRTSFSFPGSLQEVSGYREEWSWKNDSFDDSLEQTWKRVPLLKVIEEARPIHQGNWSCWLPSMTAVTYSMPILEAPRSSTEVHFYSLQGEEYDGGLGVDQYRITIVLAGIPLNEQERVIGWLQRGYL